MNPDPSHPHKDVPGPVAVRYPLAEILRHASEEYYQEELYEADLGHVSQEEIDRMTKSRRAKPSGGDS